MTTVAEAPVGREPDQGQSPVVLHRYSHRALGGSYTAVAVLVVPIYATILLLAHDMPGALYVLAQIALALALGAWIVSRARSCRLTLRPDGITEHRMFAPKRVIATDRITQAVIVPVYDTTLAVSVRLCLGGPDGRTVLRMRGWPVEAMERVVAYYGVPVARTEEPITAAQLRQERGSQLRWVDRHPVATRALQTIVCGAAAVGIVQVAMSVMR